MTLVHHALRPLTSIEDFETALAQSSQKTMVVFKHSPSCGYSAMAAEEVASWLDTTASDADVFIVDVLRSRELSRAIADRMKVRHESPQMLIIRNGVVAWHKSHISVTSDAIERAIQG